MWHCRTLVVPVVLGSFRQSASRYCMVAGHYSRSLQLAALTENSASGIYSDPSYSHVFFLDSRYGLSTSELGFGCGTCNILYNLTDLVEHNIYL